MKIKILVLTANPLGTDHLQLDEEVRAIDQALRQAELRDQYDLRSHWAVRIEELQELLLRHQPEIVHFSGHGTEGSGIILENADGSGAPVSAAALGELFRLLKDNVRCVVLNACYSAPQAQAIAQHVDVVIGMSNAIDDRATINFAAAFYRALGFGRSVKTAFQLGCNQIALAGLSEQDVPQMVALHADPARITIPPSILQSGAHYGWALLTVIPLLVLLYFLLQILYRWGGIDPGFLSFAVSLLSIVSLLLAILGITSEWGKQAAGAMWDSVVGRVPQLRETRNIFVVVCGIAGVAALGFYVGLPALARHQNARGLAALERGAYSEAVQALGAAVNLDPAVALYHYNLGYVHEAGQETDKAIDEYRHVLERDDSFWPVYNNLGRLLAAA